MSVILGLNAYHGDAAACLLVDGRMIAAAEEERFRRVKHWAGFPSEAIAWCLAEGGLSLSDVDVAAVNSDPTANLLKKFTYTVTRRPDLRLALDRLKNATERTSVGEDLARCFPDAPFKGGVKHVEHHLAHLHSAFSVSPFDESVVVSVDGFGDFSSSAWGMGRGTALQVEGRVYFPHSLGIFYQALTQYLGFPNYGDEYKVMGLAPYGEPRFMAEMRRIVHLLPDGGFKLDTAFFRHHKEKIEYKWDGGSPHVGELFSPRLEEMLGPRRGREEPLEQKHWDLARSVQAMYEEAFFHLLNVLHPQHGCDALAIAGGCGMNSVANGKVALNTPFKRVYIQSAAGDAGGAVGAAMAVWLESGGARQFVMDHAFWGPQSNEAEIFALLDGRADSLKAQGCVVEKAVDEAALIDKTAQAIADGQVVGWFQGRMEWGPRALGNRSILCDPRRADMKEILNLKIKRRESFRPFAPSILREAAGDWFEVDDDVPFMMKVFQIRPERREQIPAVTHVDGSGRLQTVYAETNPLYHRLISRFAEISGAPLVLNTSFNENEPVVCRPEEALDCFLRTRMDLLVLGGYMVKRTVS